MSATVTIVNKFSRRHRFHRNPEFRSENSRAGRMALTSRDIDLIAFIASVRYASTDNLCRKFCCSCPREFKPRQKSRPAAVIAHRAGCSCTCGSQTTVHAKDCQKLYLDDKHVASRARELFFQSGGYLERPVVQLALRLQGKTIMPGTGPLVYGVTREGLALVDRARRLALGIESAWVTRHDGSRHLAHCLSVTSVGVGVDVGLRGTNLRRLSEAELRATLRHPKRARPWQLNVRYKNRGRGVDEQLSVIPDLVFAIEQGSKRYHYMVECDLGHMPVVRDKGRDLKRSSILRKLIGYAKAYEENLHRTEFLWLGMRVLILTTSKERVLSCAEAARDCFGSNKVGKIFLFGALDEASRDLFNYDFATVDGKSVKLVG